MPTKTLGKFQMQKQRPRGITILAILIIISGAISFFGIVAGPFGIASAILGIIYIIMGYGLYKGRGWAWTGTIISFLVGIGMSVVSIIITINNLPEGVQSSSITIGIYAISLAISFGFAAAILYYLYRPHVKAYFGR
jgi:hypothetical protein